jgi:hypothetical protein
MCHVFSITLAEDAISRRPSFTERLIIIEWELGFHDVFAEDSARRFTDKHVVQTVT